MPSPVDELRMRLGHAITLLSPIARSSGWPPRQLRGELGELDNRDSPREVRCRIQVMYQDLQI